MTEGFTDHLVVLYHHTGALSPRNEFVAESKASLVLSATIPGLNEELGRRDEVACIAKADAGKITLTTCNSFEMMRLFNTRLSLPKRALSVSRQCRSGS
jgi:hypothetical protein